MTRAELIDALAAQQPHLMREDVELTVRLILGHMGTFLANRERVEIRGFGSLSTHYRAARRGRNPKTGTSVAVPPKYVPHFKAGKEMREQVEAGRVNGAGDQR